MLLARILRGDLRPGDLLVETRIAQELGTSQAPVREALRDLELLRLVESQPFRSARVREVSDDDLLDVFPVRAVLEELAAREAVKRDDLDFAPLEAEVEAMERAAKSGDIDAQLSHDIAFHRVLVESSGNKALVAAWNALGIEVPTAFGVFWTYFDRLELVEFHRTLVAAMRTGDPAAAGREARKHVLRTQRVVRRRRKERAAAEGRE